VGTSLMPQYSGPADASTAAESAADTRSAASAAPSRLSSHHSSNPPAQQPPIQGQQPPAVRPPSSDGSESGDDRPQGDTPGEPVAGRPPVAGERRYTPPERLAFRRRPVDGVPPHAPYEGPGGRPQGWRREVTVPTFSEPPESTARETPTPLGGGPDDEDIPGDRKVTDWQAAREIMHLDALRRMHLAKGGEMPAELERARPGLAGGDDSDDPEEPAGQNPWEQLVADMTAAADPQEQLQQDYYDDRPAEQMEQKESEKLGDEDEQLDERQAKIRARENVAEWAAEDRRGSYELPGDRLPVSKLAAAPSSIGRPSLKTQSPARRDELQDWDEQQETWTTPEKASPSTGTRPKQRQAEQPPLHPRRGTSTPTAPPRPPSATKHLSHTRASTVIAAAGKQSLASARAATIPKSAKSQASTLASERRASHQVPSSESLRDDASKQTDTEAKSMARSSKTARTPNK
jgi:hypothetical protein